MTFPTLGDALMIDDMDSLRMFQLCANLPTHVNMCSSARIFYLCLQPTCSPTSCALSSLPPSSTDHGWPCPQVVNYDSKLLRAFLPPFLRILHPQFFKCY